MKRDQGLIIARQFKNLLLSKGFPIQRVLLFGSVAKGTARDDSDIDIAVITLPFLPSRIKEGSSILHTSKDIDLRIETVTLHPEDFDRPFFTLGREIERTGVEV